MLLLSKFRSICDRTVHFGFKMRELEIEKQKTKIMKKHTLAAGRII